MGSGGVVAVSAYKGGGGTCGSGVLARDECGRRCR